MISVIIPAAGLAKRMRPLSSNSSKTMIPVNGKPIIAYILDELKNVKDLNKIVIVENGLHDIKEFIKYSYSNLNIECVEQKNPEGPLHAINVGYVDGRIDESDSVFVWLGDTIVCKHDFDFSKNFLGYSEVTDHERWCLVDEFLNYYDKPESRFDVPTNKALIGLYFFKDGHTFKTNIAKAMKMEKIKNEHQISSLLQQYDDFALLDSSVDWYDCGELNTYYESKAKLLNRSSGSREFNNMKVDTNLFVITKTAVGSMAEKIENEKRWYKALNETQSLFTPRILDSHLGELKMTWESGTTLSEMFLYERVGKDNWTLIINKIINTMFDYYYKPQEITSEVVDACYGMYVTNASNRIEKIKFDNDEDKKLVTSFVRDVGIQSLTNIQWSNVIHGDLHFGNIIFEPYNGSFKLIDPRGKFGNIVGPQGDIKYDFAKLLHDWFGGYIYINNGYQPDLYIPNVEIHTHIKNVIIDAMQKRFSKEDIAHIIKMSIFLCITCIPLHSDKPTKQNRLLRYSIKNIKDEVWNM